MSLQSANAFADVEAFDRPSSAAAFQSAARIAVKSVNRVVIVPVGSVIRLEAEDNYVRIWADRPYLHKETLTRLVARLDPGRFVRVHRSHALNADYVRELRPLPHGEYLVLMADGSQVTTGRSYRDEVREAFDLS